MRATLQCIRCGACMNHCPVYPRISGHAYGTTYLGPISGIISPHLLGQVAARSQLADAIWQGWGAPHARPTLYRTYAWLAARKQR